MENLLREILAPSPLLSSTPLPLGFNSEESSESQAPSTGRQGVTSLPDSTLDWEGEEEMRRLLDMLPDVRSNTKMLDVNVDTVDFPSALDLDLSGWVPPPFAVVDAF